jgi:hypothetical protein
MYKDNNVPPNFNLPWKSSHFSAWISHKKLSFRQIQIARSSSSNQKKEEEHDFLFSKLFTSVLKQTKAEEIIIIIIC